jgi:hypothetical protein
MTTVVVNMDGYCRGREATGTHMTTSIQPVVNVNTVLCIWRALHLLQEPI